MSMDIAIKMFIQTLKNNNSEKFKITHMSNSGMGYIRYGLSVQSNHKQPLKVRLKHNETTLAYTCAYTFHTFGKQSRRAGVPNPSGPRTGTGPRPVRNRAAQQEVSDRQVSEASFAAPHHSHCHLNHHAPPPPVHGKIVFHETGPLVPKRLGTADVGGT